MKTAGQGIALIKHFEGLRTTAYQDSVGVWTIGYGHTKTARPEQTIKPEQAEALLRADLVTAEDAVNKLVTVPLQPSQFDALVAFTFNVGAGALKSSTLLKLLNAGKCADAAEQFKRWNKAGGKVLNGLTARRAAEEALFKTGKLNF